MTPTETFIVALVGVLVTGIPAIVAAVYGAKNSTKNDNIAAAVSTPPDKPALGVLVSDAAEVVDHVHDIVCNGTPSGEHPAVPPAGGTRTS